jgi:hypothetical protein
MDADSGFTAIPPITPDELEQRKEFAGLDAEAVSALSTLRPWIEEHAHEMDFEVSPFPARPYWPSWQVSRLPIVIFKLSFRIHSC